MRTSLLAVLALLVALPAVAGTPPPSVARPSLPIGAAPYREGTVFFVRTDTGATAAVGTAHTLTQERVAQAGRVDLRLGGSGDAVAASTGFLVAPGLPFSDAGGTLASDFFVYALDAAPQGVLPLALAPGIPRRGSPVRVLGIPSAGGTDQVELLGRVTAASSEEIEVELEDEIDLRGWGGAPVLSVPDGRVVGILQGKALAGEHPRLSVAPIDGVSAALAGVGRDERGRAFAEWSAAPRGDAVVSTLAKNADVSVEPILMPGDAEGTQVVVEIEYPAQGAVTADHACGTFIAGRAMALKGSNKQFDVALVIDTSGSTADATGADINGNGVVGAKRKYRLGNFFGGSTDDGDSVLAAEVGAARQILRGLDPRTTRVAVITFAGDEARGTTTPPATTREPLTHEYSRVEKALDFILRTVPVGGTHMSGAVDHATMELLGLRGSRSEKNPNSEKLVFFFTDGQPTLPFAATAVADNTRAVRRAAGRAAYAGIRIHAFAIGSEALAGPIATVELAERTGGSFVPVRHPGELADVVDAMNFANLGQVALRSVTTGVEATPFRVTADGSWGGFVKMVPGINVIQISARSTDGAEVQETLKVVHEPAADEQPIPADLGFRHNRLLEDCLRDLKEVRVAAEAEQAEKVRKNLLLEITREREQARKRAAEQRKQLELEVEDE